VQPIRFELLKAALAATASAARILEVLALVQQIIAQRVTAVALARRTNATTQTRSCPHCASHNVVRHGHDQNRRQRFKCRACGRTYNILTGTPMARARKPQTWSRCLGLMSDHHSVRAIVAAGIGVSHVTVWRWRHRFLMAAATDTAPLLCGVIEAAATVFPRSCKGARGGPSEPAENPTTQPRASDPLTRGRAGEPVAVLSALDSGGGIYETILPSLAGIEAALHGRIAAGSVLCSDGDAAYAAVAEQADAEPCVIQPARLPLAAIHPPRRTSRLGLGRVIAYHKRLRMLIHGRCRGVATRYLDHYLGWHRAMTRGVAGTALLERALA
jgi:transposase-like protein